MLSRTVGLPLQLNGLASKRLQEAFAAAPWGHSHTYTVEHMAEALVDWRSWKALYNETFCLSSIVLQQKFPEAMCASCISMSSPVLLSRLRRQDVSMV